MLRILHF